MNTRLEQDTWLDSGVFLEPVSEEGKQFWAYCIELGKKYNIHLPTATEKERSFILELAEESFYSKEAV